MTQAVLDLIRDHVDPTTLALVADAFADSSRMSIIRDMFLEGRDAEAIAALRDLNPTGLYKLLPMSTGDTIMPGQSAQLTSRPQVPFRVTRLLVSRHCNMFLINDIRLATRSMFAQSGDIPADLFAGDYDSLENPIQGELVDGLWTIRCPPRAIPLMGLPISMPEAEKGQEIIVLASNAGDEAHDFRAAFLGFARYH